MDWQLATTLAGIIIGAISAGLYIRTILSGETKPHRVTWGGWTFVGLLGLLSSRNAGAGIGLLVAASFVIEVAIIFCLSMVPKYGKPGGTKPELLAGVVAGIALMTMLVIDYPPGIGTTIAIVADLVFLWPTLKAAWLQPDTEAIHPWVIGAIAIALGTAALGKYSYAAAGYSYYIFLGNIAVFTALMIQKPRFDNKTKKMAKTRTV